MGVTSLSTQDKWGTEQFAAALKSYAPTVTISAVDVLDQSVKLIESVCRKSGIDPGRHQPLLSMVQNADMRGPQYRFHLTLTSGKCIHGYMNARSINFIYDDPISKGDLKWIFDFSDLLPECTIDAVDDDNNEIQL